jgi:hypothetical protein
MHMLLLLLQVMCFPSNHLAKLKASTRSSRRLKRLHDLLDVDITMDTYESWPYDLQQVRVWVWMIRLCRFSTELAGAAPAASVSIDVAAAPMV